ncbi:4Fe-4S binding protein [Candidatus Woesearchaeota archaeon]|jgi:NAD-dependent dihydropyrimidine dehydrogenase PreA subunit|nr:4Fe-4S binding protein [Candidatus Woesearchaeota archaeon]
MTQPIPIVDESKCVGCKTCIDVCPMDVFVMENNKSKVVKPKECIGCRACEAQCSAQCIKIEEK